MLGYDYTFTNSYNGKSFTIGVDDSGNQVSSSGRGLLLQEYPNFTLDVRNEERSKLGQHGIWDFFSFYGKRSITFSGIILGSSHLDVIQWEQKIQEVLTLPAQPISSTNDGYVAITWTDASGLPWQINAKIQQDVVFRREIGNQLRASFFVGLKSSDPFILSQTSKSIEELHGWRADRLFLPTFLPSYFNLVYNNLINIYQVGTADAPAVYRMYGPITTPKITQLREVFVDDTTVDNFTTGWSGGTDDAIHFQTGINSQKITSTGTQATMSKSNAYDYTGARYITFYFYVDDVDNIAYGGDDYSVGENYIKFIESAGVDEFVAELELGNSTIKTGWNYFTLLRDQFKTVGAPSWEDITSIECSCKAKAGTTLNISFDDLHSRNITYSELKLELSGTISAGDYVDFDVLNGTIENSSGTDLSSSLSSDSEWFFLYPKQNLLLMESSLTPAVSGILPYVYNDPVVETGLAGYWHFDEDTLTDYLANNDGVATGAINFKDSSVHGSLRQIELDGASYIDMGCPYDNFFVTSATISMFIEFDDFTANQFIASRLFGQATYPYIEYSQATDVLRVRYQLDGVNKTLNIASSVSSSFSTHTPYHLLIKFDVTTGVSAWFNLTTTASDSNTGAGYNAGVANMRFGANAAGSTFLRGSLDEIRVYNTLLTTAQIYQLYYTPEQNKLLQQVSVTWNDAML
jgi:hypothetical protein